MNSSIIRKQHTYFFNNDRSFTKHLSCDNKHRRSFYQTFHNERITISRKKKDFLNQEKSNEIEKQNKLLFSRITGIMGGNSRSRYYSIREPKRSLNQGKQKKEWQKIEIENAKLLERIVHQKSHYEFGKSVQQKGYFNRKTMLRKIPRVQTMPVVPGIVQSKNRLQKTLNFQGQILNILISLTRGSLIIQGKTSSGISKIISIPKQQALDFIQTECDSNIQKLFDRLSYKQQTLYLTGKPPDKKLQNVIIKDQFPDIVQTKQNKVQNVQKLALVQKGSQHQQF